MTVEKRPIGIKPKYIHDEQRKNELIEAINRYLNANCKIPLEWICEYNSFCK